MDLVEEDGPARAGVGHVGLVLPQQLVPLVGTLL